MQFDTTWKAESKEELKISWLKCRRIVKKKKKQKQKPDLKLNIQKTKIMASGPITSWQIVRETMETVRDFHFLGLQNLQMVTAAMKLKDACSLEEKLWQN